MGELLDNRRNEYSMLSPVALSHRNINCAPICQSFLDSSIYYTPIRDLNGFESLQNILSPKKESASIAINEEELNLKCLHHLTFEQVKEENVKCQKSGMVNNGIQCCLDKDMPKKDVNSFLIFLNEGYEKLKLWLRALWMVKVANDKYCTSVENPKSGEVSQVDLQAIQRQIDAVLNSCKEIKQQLQDHCSKTCHFSAPPFPMTAAPPPPPPFPLTGAPPPPPPPPPPPDQVIFKKQPVKDTIKQPMTTPRPVISVHDLASVRLRKVNVRKPQETNFSGQLVTVEQLRSIKLKPRRKDSPRKQSPATPVCRERKERLRQPLSPRVRADRNRPRPRPRLDGIPLSQILNLDESL